MSPFWEWGKSFLDAKTVVCPEGVKALSDAYEGGEIDLAPILPPELQVTILQIIDSLFFTLPCNENFGDIGVGAIKRPKILNEEDKELRQFIGRLPCQWTARLKTSSWTCREKNEGS
jgi:hypothetical protein